LTLHQWRDFRIGVAWMNLEVPATWVTVLDLNVRATASWPATPGARAHSPCLGNGITPSMWHCVPVSRHAAWRACIVVSSVPVYLLARLGLAYTPVFTFIILVSLIFTLSSNVYLTLLKCWKVESLHQFYGIIMQWSFMCPNLQTSNHKNSTAQAYSDNS